MVKSVTTITLLISIVGQLRRLTSVAIGRPVAILIAAAIAILRTGAIGRAVMASWTQCSLLLLGTRFGGCGSCLLFCRGCAHCNPNSAQFVPAEQPANV